MPDNVSLQEKIEAERREARGEQKYLKELSEAHAPGPFKKATRKLKQRVRIALNKSRERIKKLRKKKGDKPSDARQKLVAYAQWGCDNTASIHYAQTRPIDGLTADDQRRLPLSTDCSGFVTKAYKDAGQDDPNGYGFNGYGYTGTLAAHGHNIPKAEAQPGDLVIHGYDNATTHVTMLVESGTVADPYVVSHGQEAGPFKVRNSVEINAHAGQPCRFYRYL